MRRTREIRESLSKGLEILFLLASHRFGLTREELCDEVGLSRTAFFEYMNTLKNVGIEIEARKEPLRHAWCRLYRLRTIRGVPFSLTTRLVPTNHG